MNRRDSDNSFRRDGGGRNHRRQDGRRRDGGKGGWRTIEDEPNPDIIAGFHPVREFLIKNPKRVSKVLISKNSSGLDEIISAAKARGVPFHFVPPEKLPREGFRRANVAAVISTAALLGAEDLKKKAAGNDARLFIVLDEITDPRNLGAIIRSAVCFGADGVVIQKWRAAGLTSAVHAASAGASASIDVFSVPNVKHAIGALKELDYTAVGSSSENGAPLDDFKFPAKIALVVGSEESGMKKTVGELCDLTVSIPHLKTIASLNASVAAGIILYCAQKQRRTNTSPQK